MSISESQSTLLGFFEFLFEHDEGYVCIATTRPPARRDTFQEKFFEWPKDKLRVLEYIDKVTPTHNVYFGINVLSAPKRRKDNCIPQNLVWADLDACSPDQLDIPPQLVIESSPNRYQAVWRLDRKIDPLIAENYGRRLAYHYADLGVDKSGFDLTQLLRVPGTYNFKYQMDESPTVRVLAQLDATLDPTIFDSLPEPEGADYEGLPDIDVPDLRQSPTADMILYRFADQMRQLGIGNTFARYYSTEPQNDWSGALWRLLLLCFEAGMSAEETFVIAKNAKCNKYERDNRPDSHLWREVLKAELERKSLDVLIVDHRHLVFPALLTATEEDQVAANSTIINDYMSWATAVTDAVPEFHEISCTMLLSSLMATTLRLKTSRAQAIVPNLWALILGESTLTRKTTAMDMAMDFVIEIERELLLASDATVEGLMTNLSKRPKEVSIFYRDEVAGFFDALAKRDYLAGMHETMTKLYDVPKYLARMLKKETYVVSEPIFIFFGGGTPEKMYSLVTEDNFASGFIPRFLIMRGYADSSKIRPTGPPDTTSTDTRNDLLSTFRAYYHMYTDQQITVDLHDGQKMVTTPEIEVIMGPEVWARAAEMEQLLLKAAQDSPEAAKALPMFSRMFVSLLKMTMLFAAARQEPENYLIGANMDDLLTAAYYIQRWGVHAVDLVRNSGVSTDESKIMSVYRLVEKRPGITRGEVMSTRRLNAYTMQMIEDTLQQRLLINVQAVSGRKGKSYWPIGQ